MTGAVQFADFLKDVQQRVEADLSIRLEAEELRVTRDAAELVPLVKQVRELTSRGGKRLRAALVLLGYRLATRGPDDAVALPAAAAMELLQTYFLVHDDWMDDDPVRRGGPSVHYALRAHYGSDKLGDSGAILGGDYAVSLAQEALLACEVTPSPLLAAARAFAELQRDVVLGQGLDVLVDSPTGERGLGRLMARTHLWKTAAYTTTGPLLIGARLGGASEAQQQALRAYGDPLGIAFQLRDDWLGTFGDPERTGKSIDSDLRQGKKTAVLAALEEDPAQQTALQEFLRDGAARDRGDDEVLAMRTLLDRAGVSARVDRAIGAESARARAALPALEASHELTAWLDELIRLVAERGA